MHVDNPDQLQAREEIDVTGAVNTLLPWPPRTLPESDAGARVLLLGLGLGAYDEALNESGVQSVNGYIGRYAEDCPCERWKGVGIILFAAYFVLVVANLFCCRAQDRRHALPHLLCAHMWRKCHQHHHSPIIARPNTTEPMHRVRYARLAAYCTYISLDRV